MGNEMALSVHDAFQLGLKHQTAGRLEEAEAIYRQVLDNVPDHAASLHYLGIVRFKQGDVDDALALVKRSVDLRPRDANFLQNMGGMLKDLGRHAEAIGLLEAAVEDDADNFAALSNLCSTLHAMEDDDRAAGYGQAALEAKDRDAFAVYAEKYGEPKLECWPKRFEASDRRKNIISFSLWGTDAYYIEGAIENAFLARHIYPEWMCRFYVDASIPKDVIERLVQLGAQVIQFNEASRDNYGLFWRFFVANDPTVDRFLCRDCDCRLNVKERVAVEEWIESNQCFHIMRDSVIHSELILAGMWGGIAGVLPDIREKSEEYYRSYGDRWADQHFLREEIWPLIKPYSLTHDSHYELGNSKPFPRYGTIPRPGHVGGSVARKQQA